MIDEMFSYLGSQIACPLELIKTYRRRPLLGVGTMCVELCDHDLLVAKSGGSICTNL